MCSHLYWLSQTPLSSSDWTSGFGLFSSTLTVSAAVCLMCECVYHGCCYWCQNTAALCLSCSLGLWETVVMETDWWSYLLLYPTVWKWTIDPWGLWSRSWWRQGGIQHTHISISPAECLGKNMNMNGEWRRVLISQRWLTACSMDSAWTQHPYLLYK